MLPESKGRVMRPYDLDEIPTVGVFGNEPFALRFHNFSSMMVQVRLSLDGTDVLTGKNATDSPFGEMWVVRAHQSLTLEAWPENQEGGAAFVFTDAVNSVALHTHGDMTAKGYISAAVFTEGHQPMFTIRGGGFGGMRGGTLGAPEFESYGTKGHSGRLIPAGPAIGAGQYTQQQVRWVLGLIEPRFSKLIQVRYLWWDDLQARLRQEGVPPSPNHPTGFVPAKMADLGTTPRLDPPGAPAAQREYSRFL